MWAVDKVTEEGGAEVTAGVETGQDKVWIAWLGVFPRTETLLTDRLDTRAALFSRRLLFRLTELVLRCEVKVLWVSIRVCGTTR